jgi:hypothetical protein
MMQTHMILQKTKAKVQKMSELGVIASKFSANRESLQRFDEALRYLKTNRELKQNPQTKEALAKLLNVLSPISDNINDVLSESLAITEQGVVDIIKERHSHNWPTYRQALLDLVHRLKEQEFHVSDSDIDVLNDVGDALDAECTELFNRLGEGR